MKKLSSLQSSLPQLITQVEEGDLKHRLYDLGVYPDQTIKMLKKAPFGDPLLVDVEGQTVMLRLSEADLISVVEK